MAHVVGLLCLRQAKEGGESQFASALAVHNKLLQKRPDVLELLYRGWPQHRRGEQQDGEADITPYDMPVYCNVDGKVSIQYVRELYDLAMRDSGRAYTPQETEAHDVLQSTAREVEFEMRLEPGEAAVCNNLTIMHARNIFVDFDEEDKRRTMVRLWLDPHNPDMRPTVPEFWRYRNPSGHSGIDPAAGHIPAPPKYRIDR